MDLPLSIFVSFRVEGNHVVVDMISHTQKKEGCFHVDILQPKELVYEEMALICAEMGLTRLEGTKFIREFFSNLADVVDKKGK
jgi:hypothetical protein